MSKLEKRVIDWEAIELAYRSGVLSTREIGAQHTVSHTLINRKAKAEQWDRDLSAKIKLKAAAIVSKSGVSSSVSTETETIAANADLIAGVQITHRTDVQRTRKLAMVLLEELEIITSDNALLRDLGTMMYSPDKSGVDRLNDAYNKVISMAGRIDALKKLAETLKTLIGLEREAFGLDESRAGESETDRIIRMIGDKYSSEIRTTH